MTPAAGFVGDELADRARRILSNMEDGICPRCGAALGPFPARSRITEDRCVPACGECGGHEAIGHLPIGLPTDTIADWRWMPPSFALYSAPWSGSWATS